MKYIAYLTGISIFLFAVFILEISIPMSFEQIKTNNQTSTDLSSLSSSSNNNQTKLNPFYIDQFDISRSAYFNAWNKTNFHSNYDAFIDPKKGINGSRISFGNYITKDNVFNPLDNIVLYVEPVGYGYDQKKIGKSNNINIINITANIKIADPFGNKPQINNLSRDIIMANAPLYSYNKKTEIYLYIPIVPNHPWSKGEYNIEYTITDLNKRESFILEKGILIR
jgi:hypothetical protein